jgi:hypothetical protein
MRDEKEAVEHAESQRRHGEEIYRGNCLARRIFTQHSRCHKEFQMI